MINYFKTDMEHHVNLYIKFLGLAQEEFAKTSVIENKYTLLLILKELILPTL